MGVFIGRGRLLRSLVCDEYAVLSCADEQWERIQGELSDMRGRDLTFQSGAIPLLPRYVNCRIP